MNILLIAPSIRISLSGHLNDGMPKRISKNFGVYPHLGLCYLAASLRKNNFKVQIIDLNVEKISAQELFSIIQKTNPGLIGISNMTFTFLQALDLARQIKSNFQIPIIFGGNHVSIYPREVISHDCVDIGVIGEGELTILEIANLLKDKKITQAGQELERIKGIVFKAGTQTIVTGPREFISDLDQLPFPAVDLLKSNKYYGCNLATPYMTMITARGCPYACSFCSKYPWGQQVRYNSAKRVVDEIEYLVKNLGVKAIDFFDDTFIFNKSRIEEMADLIQERKIRIEFGITTRVNTVNKEILNKLKLMGCKTIAYGVESGDPEVLGRIDKKITIDQIRAAFKWAGQAGINTVGFFLVGNPLETEKEIKNTIKLIKGLNADYFIANVLVPYPGSRLYDDLLKSGDLKEDYWRKLTLEGKAKPTPLANTKVSQARLIKMRNYINRMPYLRWRSNILKFKKIKSFSDIKRSLNTLRASCFDRSL
ncbi:MAG TPA: radical SAM protein [Candidatus Omnitrophota bacterium]|nr:radical SAM protein [Candidatus Omnitrophota bacterium]HPT39207.1 radical SAM protein [Candidatus Omnitrophota bacterium]